MTDYRGYVIKPHAIRKREMEAIKARAGDDWVDHVGDHPPEWYGSTDSKGHRIRPAYLESRPQVSLKL
jgi:hypothetical protein